MIGTTAPAFTVEHPRPDARVDDIPPGTYALDKPANLFAYYQRLAAYRDGLDRRGMLPLVRRPILDVGCGSGEVLSMFDGLGADRRWLSGIDLSADHVRSARSRLAGSDIRVGDAAKLPWADASFDIVSQSATFSTILSRSTRRKVASEMVRVLRPGGMIFWYDYFVDNPFNRSVRGIRRKELTELFGGFSIELRRVTLASTLARRLVPVSWRGASLLEQLGLLNTHYLVCLYR